MLLRFRCRELAAAHACMLLLFLFACPCCVAPAASRGPLVARAFRRARVSLVLLERMCMGCVACAMVAEGSAREIYTLWCALHRRDHDVSRARECAGVPLIDGFGAARARVSTVAVGGACRHGVCMRPLHKSANTGCTVLYSTVSRPLSLVSLFRGRSTASVSDRVRRPLSVRQSCTRACHFSSPLQCTPHHGRLVVCVSIVVPAVLVHSPGPQSMLCIFAHWI